MSDVAGELLVQWGRTTLALGAAVCFAGITLRLAHVSNPVAHRAACVLALVVGWTFVRLPLVVPWYEPAVEVPAVSNATLAEVNEFASPEIGHTPSPEPGDSLELAAALPSSPVEPLPVTELDILPGAAPVAVDLAVPSAPQTEIGAATIELSKESLPGESSAAADAELAAVEIAPVTPLNTTGDVAITAAAMDAPPHSATSTARAEQLARLLLGGWAVGIVGIVACWLWGYCRFVIRLPVGQVADDEWAAEWRQLVAHANINRDIPLRVTTELGPMLCRLPRGYELLVPAALWSELDARQRLCILRHELAHYQRNDVWKSLAVRLLALPHWFNPLAWRAVRRFDEAAEWACDERAAADEPVTAYARALLKLGESARQHAAYSPGANGRTLAARIRRLLSRAPHRDSVAKNLLVGMVLGTILAAALVRVELVAREPNTEPTSNTLESANNTVATVDDSGDVAAQQHLAAPQLDKTPDKLLSPELLEAAEAGYKVALSDFENDKITLHEVCAWSLRWLSAAETAERVVTTSRATANGPVEEETIEPPSEEERAAALRAHLGRMKELQARIVALFDAGVRGGEAEKKALMNYYVADAERRLKRFEVWQKNAQRTAKVREQTALLAVPVSEPMLPTAAGPGKPASPGGTESAAARYLLEQFGLQLEVVRKEELSPPDRERFRGGLRVVSLDSPAAAKVGLRVGDIILGMGSNDIMRETVSLQGAVTAIGLSVGSPVVIQWSRDGEQSVAELPRASELRRDTQSATPRNAVPVLRSAPVPRSPNDPPRNLGDEVVLGERLGIQVAHVPASEFHQRPEEQYEGGLRVERLANATVEAGGLRVRDVIVAIDGTATPTVEAARTVLDRIAARPFNIHFRRDAQTYVIEIPTSTDATTQRETRLKKQYDEKSAKLVREMNEIEQLQTKLGIVDPTDLGLQSQRLQSQLNGTQGAIYALTAEISKADEDVDSLQLDISLAQDPAAREIRAEEELGKDERLRRFEDEISRLDDALADARAQGKGEGDVAITSVAERRAALEERIHERRDQLIKRFAEANEAIRVKQLQGKLTLATKHRDRLQEQLVALKRDADEVRAQIAILHKSAPELQTRLQRIRALQTETDGMNKELHTLWLQKQNLAPPTGDSSDNETSQKPGLRSRQGYEKLRKLAHEKKLQLEREQGELQKLQTALGLVDSARIGERKDALRSQSSVIKASLDALQSQSPELESRADQLKLDIALAQDPAAKDAQIEEEIRKDEKMKKLEDQLQDYDSAIAETQRLVDGKNDKALQRLEKTRYGVEEKIENRRDELRKKFVDANEGLKVKELQGKLAAVEKHLKAHAEQKAELEKQLEELNHQLQRFDRDAADLENRQQRVRTLEQMILDLDRELEKQKDDVDTDSSSTRRTSDVEQIADRTGAAIIEAEGGSDSTASGNSGHVSQVGWSPVGNGGLRLAAAKSTVQSCELELSRAYIDVEKHPHTREVLTADVEYKTLQQKLADITTSVADARGRTKNQASESIALMEKRRVGLKKAVEERRLAILTNCASPNESAQLTELNDRLAAARAAVAKLEAGHPAEVR